LGSGKTPLKDPLHRREVQYFWGLGRESVAVERRGWGVIF